MKKEYAGKNEVRNLIVELVNANTDRMNRGIMCASFNVSHLMGDMKKRGMAYPENFIECSEWLRSIGIPAVCKKLAKQGHWIKGMEDAAIKFHRTKEKSPLIA
jgi:hypothetical protein